MPSKNPSHVRLKFADEEIEAVAELLWDAAPKTCAAIAAILPIRGMVHQAIYSGSESVLLLATLLKLDRENAIWDVRRGDLAFTWMAAGSSYKVTEDFAELCWFYDHDARPSMWEGPVEVNVFARIVEPAEAFYEECRAIRRKGVKAIVVEAVQPWV